MPNLTVRSNVARDVLQTASEFGNVPKMIVEYVSNSLDNPDEPGQPVKVRVDTHRDGTVNDVTIHDNGSGMDAAGLERFFEMHAENAQRQKGRRARGRFGTGKAAGFGVGTTLHIDTVRCGRRWVVELTRDELEAAGKEDREPRPEMRKTGELTDQPNGTTVTVLGIRRAAKSSSMISELRRRLGRQLETHEVYVGNQRVHLVEPEAEDSWTFSSKEYPAAAKHLGTDLICTVRAVAAGRAVDEPLRGVIVTSSEVPVAQYEALGDMSSRIFGLLEVPALDADNSTPSPFTDRRDLKLNLDNPLAAATDGWVRHCLVQVSKELQEQDRERRRQARTAELTRAASQAEAVLNQHYRNEFRALAGAGRAGGTTTRTGTAARGTRADDDGECVLPDDRGPAGYQPERSARTDPVDRHRRQRDPHKGGTPTEPSSRPKTRDPLGEGRGNPVTQLDEQRQRRSRGGFHIEYSTNGKAAPRAAYYATDLTIEINLEHPLLAAIAGNHDLFQGLAFTIAAEEYAQATANALLDDGTLEDAFDALQYIRTTMDRLSRAFAEAEVFSILTAPTAAVR